MIHIVGIVGVPGNYGGFETLADQLLDSPDLIADGVVVYCEAAVAERQGGRYKGARLVPLDWRANGWQSVIFDSIGLWRASRQGGTVLVLGTSATFWLAPLRRLFPRVNYVVNMAGLEWGRAKWGRAARWFLKFNEAQAARHAHVFIADNQGLVDYVRQVYGRRSVMIAYGGDQFETTIPDDSVFREHDLPEVYDFAMARAQVDNNMAMILEAYAESGLPLVFVSNWSGSSYGRAMLEAHAGHSNIKMIGPIYDRAKVKALHRRARLYVHGHSAGGTNPVLVEAMWAGLATLAFDVPFNRHTTHGAALYFRSAEELARLSSAFSEETRERCATTLRGIAESSYTWRSVREAYESLLRAGEETPP